LPVLVSANQGHSLGTIHTSWKV